MIKEIAKTIDSLFKKKGKETTDKWVPDKKERFSPPPPSSAAPTIEFKDFTEDQKKIESSGGFNVNFVRRISLTQAEKEREEKEKMEKEAEATAQSISARNINRIIEKIEGIIQDEARKIHSTSVSILLNDLFINLIDYEFRQRCSYIIKDDVMNYFKKCGFKVKQSELWLSIDWSKE